MRLSLLLTIGALSLGCRSGATITTTVPWFEAQRTIDLTGDARPDTVRIRADGRSSDSLVVTLTFQVDGQERWREQWYSDYMLIDPPKFPNGERDRASYVQQSLKRTLESVAVSPFDSAQYLMMADTIDSTVVRQPPTYQITLGYGYETTLVLTWDRGKKTFRVLWGCC